MTTTRVIWKEEEDKVEKGSEGREGKEQQGAEQGNKLQH